MQWPVTQPVVIKAWGRAQHGMPVYSQILKLVAKPDGARAELDGPTADLDGCATAGRGSVLPGSVLPGSVLLCRVIFA